MSINLSDCPKCGQIGCRRFGTCTERIYLCARYTRHEELYLYAKELHAIGYIVQCEWITGQHHDTDSAECARIDYAEVSGADTVISFTEAPGQVTGRGRGGRHVEFGLALGMGKRCIVVGYRENVFHHLPEVEFYESWTTTLGVLTEEWRMWYADSEAAPA